MNVTPMKARDLPFKRQYHSIGKKNKEVKTPDFYCRDCDYNCQQHCSFYSRPIVENYNRCFNHSNYKPTVTQFKPQENLAQLVEEEQEKKYA